LGNILKIKKGRANSLKLMGRLLNYWNKRNIDYHFYNFKLGGLTNAIPREAIVHISLNPAHERMVQEINYQFLQEVKNEFKFTDPNIFLNFNEYSGFIFFKKIF
jgi:di/tripeptidase